MSPEPEQLSQYQVDAFSGQLFAGNPAAVVPLPYWPNDTLLQAIAEENNLSETAFVVPGANSFHLRWFTPLREIALCGHATLAAAHVIFEVMDYPQPVITFTTRSGELFVTRKGQWLEMDFPARPPAPCPLLPALVNGLGQTPLALLAADDYLAVFDSEATVQALTPNHDLLEQLDLRGVIVTAPGTACDFVSRFFAPKFGIREDPVTGSAHCTLAPYWAQRTGKNRLTATQVSKRGGELQCEVRANRVLISGQAMTFMRAKLNLSL